MSRLALICLLLPLVGANASAAGEYVDSAACRVCHREIYDRYSSTPMARSFYPAANAPPIEDWDQNNRFYHAPSDRHYEMIRRDEQFFVRRYQQDEDGRQRNALELAVTHIMGSGMRARSYLHRTPEGRLIELPVAWYTQEGGWAMAPGYDRPQHPDFSRTVTHKCMFCHNAYPDVPAQRARPGWDSDVRFLEKLPSGIDCQRCHGPGAQHIRDASARSIVNPARLSADRQMEVCMQCHLETTTFRLPPSYRRFGRGFYSYRPGEPLGDYMVHFDHAPGSGHDEKFEIVSAAYRLRKSECFLQSEGRLVCTTCHDAHQTVPPAARAGHYRERCLRCHDSRPASRHNMDPAGFTRSDCLPCHMPLRRTEDVVRVAMTDHRIARRLPGGDLLAPRREKTDVEQQYLGPVVLYYPRHLESKPVDDLYLGIAQIKEKVNLKAGIEILKRALSATDVRAPEPYFELAEAQLSLGLAEEARINYLEGLRRDSSFVQAENNLGNLLSTMRRFPEAIQRFRRALELDPASADLHRNLGLTLVESGDLKSAGEAFRNAVAANSLYAPGWREYGSYLLLQGDVEQARIHLTRALSLDPSDALAHNNLGLALLAVGERRKALLHLRFAIRHGDPATREATGAILRRFTVESEP